MLVWWLHVCMMFIYYDYMITASVTRSSPSCWGIIDHRPWVRIATEGALRAVCTSTIRAQCWYNTFTAIATVTRSMLFVEGWQDKTRRLAALGSPYLGPDRTTWCRAPHFSNFFFRVSYFVCLISYFLFRVSSFVFLMPCFLCRTKCFSPVYRISGVFFRASHVVFLVSYQVLLTGIRYFEHVFLTPCWYFFFNNSSHLG